MNNILCYSICVIIILCQSSNGFEFVSRKEWGARPPRHTENLPKIPKYVFIHHTYIPAACYNLADCCAAMRWIQDFHMDNRSWNDFGYSFAVGGDGRVYEGRGWDLVGAHTLGYNSIGLGFVVIGDYRFDIPDRAALKTLKKLIARGLKIKKIDENYILKGHRDVRPTECPGQAFYDLIQTWPHYEPKHDDSNPNVLR